MGKQRASAPLLHQGPHRLKQHEGLAPQARLRQCPRRRGCSGLDPGFPIPCMSRGCLQCPTPGSKPHSTHTAMHTQQLTHSSGAGGPYRYLHPQGTHEATSERVLTGGHSRQVQSWPGQTPSGSSQSPQRGRVDGESLPCTARGLTWESPGLQQTPSHTLREDCLNTYCGPGMSLGILDPKANRVTNSLSTWTLAGETNDK